MLVWIYFAILVENTSDSNVVIHKEDIEGVAVDCDADGSPENSDLLNSEDEMPQEHIGPVKVTESDTWLILMI